MSISENVYETDKYVQEYLAFHFGQDQDDYMPYSDAPKQVLNFTRRIADKCAALPPGGGDGPRSALDLGCAVGAVAFELSRNFDTVVGIDFSHAFIKAANTLKEGGELPYSRKEQGNDYSQHVARVPEGLDATKCRFEQGDACNLRAE